MEAESRPPHVRPILRMSKGIDGSAVRLDTRWKVTTYAGQRDLEVWLRIMNCVFARPAGTRAWDASDVERELTSHERAGRRTCWLAEAANDSQRPAVGMLVAQERNGTRELINSPESRRSALYENHCELCIAWLGVLPTYRRQGVAAALLQHAENHARQIGASQILTETLASWNAAVVFYRRHGFQ